MTWDSVISNAMKISDAQNSGKPRLFRNCQPELKLCNMGIMYAGPNGKDIMVRTVENANGVVIQRDICEFNTFGDIRSCKDWDTGRIGKSMKDGNGTWNSITE